MIGLVFVKARLMLQCTNKMQQTYSVADIHLVEAEALRLRDQVSRVELNYSQHHCN